MRVKKERSIDRDRLLYSTDVLEAARDDFGPATEIKHAVRTSAKIYEIRTALRYWFGGSNDHRTDDVVWNRCKAVNDGNLKLSRGELCWLDGEAVA